MPADRDGRNAVQTRLGGWLVLAVLAPFILLLAVRPLLPDAMVSVPDGLVVPFTDWLNVVFDTLRNHEIFGLFTFRDVTRAVARALDWPLDIVEGILVSGIGDWGVPALPWTTIAGLAGVLGWSLAGWRLAALAGGSVTYLAIFGTWKLSMITLSVVLVSAPIAVAIAMALGIAAYTWRRFERVLWPILNVMQSLPHFSYLIPIAVFIGVSHRAGAVATILFAIPPMARLTILGLRGVPSEVVDAGHMSGSTPLQMLFKVKIPTARDTLLVGLNQVIMLCLAMVVIASFVGAKGLGADLLYRLQNLQIGRALESGIAIVLMAITLDRLSRALAVRQPVHRPAGPVWRRYPGWSVAAGVAAVTILAALVMPAAYKWPSDWALTTAPMWDRLVREFTIHLYEPLSIFRDDLLVYILIPLRGAFQWLPWTAMIALVLGLGWRIGGVRLAFGVAGFVLFIALSGYWDRAVITVYMVFSALVVCVAIGLPVGILAAHSDRATRIMEVVCDTFQTFPSFIYLIPVIMLFQVGDVAAITAVVIYSGIPIVRYTMFGLRNVSSETVEAAATSGCTRRQTLWYVRLPLALPEIMLGINQTIMFALFMVIIAGFIGTTDLGQEIFRARAENDAGKGLVLGLCVAFIGLAADQLINGWSRRRKQLLGLS